MKPHSFSPAHLDVDRFAEQAASLEGTHPLTEMTRLVDSAHPDAPPVAGDEVVWQARGERRTVRGEPVQTWLHLSAQTRLALTCQRCLQPLSTDIMAERSFRFVADEATAAELDAESDDDVLAMNRALSVLTLVEDELLLSLPLVPRHVGCAMPPHDRGDGPEFTMDDSEGAPPNPFDVLAHLKPKRGVN